LPALRFRELPSKLAQADFAAADWPVASAQKISPKQNHRHGQKRCHQDAQLRRELIFRFSQRRQLIHRRSASRSHLARLTHYVGNSLASLPFLRNRVVSNLPDSGWHRSSAQSAAPRNTPPMNQLPPLGKSKDKFTPELRILVHRFCPWR